MCKELVVSAIRWSQSATSLQLNGVKFAITWNLFVIRKLTVINQQKLQICCYLDGNRAEIHIKWLHVSQNLEGVKLKYGNTSTNTDGVAAGQEFNCKMHHHHHTRWFLSFSNTFFSSFAHLIFPLCNFEFECAAHGKNKRTPVS